MAQNWSRMTNALQRYSEAQIRSMMKAEGEELKRIAVKLWRQYIDSYKPSVYVRTENSEKAIKLGHVKKLEDGSFAIELTWRNDLVYHDSVVVGSTTKGHSVMLISDGWHSKKLEQKIGRRIYRYTYFEGIGYLDRVYKEYMKRAPQWIRLETQWSGKYTKK